MGENARPFTTLYWDFLNCHKETFRKNHRMRQQLSAIKRLTDLEELRERATQVMDGLDNGLV